MTTLSEGGTYNYPDQLFLTLTAAVLQRDIVIVHTNPREGAPVSDPSCTKLNLK